MSTSRRQLCFSPESSQDLDDLDNGAAACASGAQSVPNTLQSSPCGSAGTAVHLTSHMACHIMYTCDVLYCMHVELCMPST